MSDHASEFGTEVYDETEAYDREHGKPTLADTQRLVNLSEGANKPPPQYVPFKVSQKGG